MTRLATIAAVTLVGTANAFTREFHLSGMHTQHVDIAIFIDVDIPPASIYDYNEQITIVKIRSHIFFLCIHSIKPLSLVHFYSPTKQHDRSITISPFHGR